MKVIIKITFLLVLFILSSGQVSQTYAQLREPGVTEDNYRAIQQALDQKMGPTYKVIGIVNFDSAQTAESWIFEEPVEDPYGTLANCYLFFASTRFISENENGASDDPKERVGIFKNGRILWLSNPLITPIAFAGGDFWGSLDLNQDQKVEFIISLFSGMRGRGEVLWIFSWDGSSAELISNVDGDGRSTIRMRRDLSELIDIEPDEILEIKGENFDGSSIIFSWNGLEYGDRGTSLPARLPRDAVDVLVNAEIKMENERFRYKYILDNSVQSLQSIEEFALKRLVKEKKGNGPKGWSFRANLKKNLMSWQVESPLDYHRDALLSPGEQAEFFIITNPKGLPKPSNYYTKGNNGDLTFSVNEILTNSVSGTTIVPANPPDPFDSGTFTDSLRSYTTQACELEWITNQGICKSLQSKLDNVKKQLERGNTNTAGNVLEAFINEVEAQKGRHLTSEGYGLLYYNAAYLKEQLKE